MPTPGLPPHCCAAEPKPQGKQAAGAQRAPHSPFQTPSLLDCTRLGRDILIPDLFFFKFQFSCISIRCVNVSGIISLASSQHTFGRDAQQHHALGMHRRRVTSPEKGRVPTHTGRTAKASLVLRCRHSCFSASLCLRPPHLRTRQVQAESGALTQSRGGPRRSSPNKV